MAQQLKLTFALGLYILSPFLQVPLTPLKHAFLQNYEKIKQGMKKDENVRGNTNLWNTYHYCKETCLEHNIMRAIFL